MLGSKEGAEPHAGLEQAITGMADGAVDRGLIGEESDPRLPKPGRVAGKKSIDPELHRCHRRTGSAASTFAARAM